MSGVPRIPGFWGSRVWGQRGGRGDNKIWRKGLGRGSERERGGDVSRGLKKSQGVKGLGRLRAPPKFKTCVELREALGHKNTDFKT